ncbi:hypothetical protein HYZ97_00770 [Candidatus Pacearchaeota archaeon]|nr:hypothetical protein [Candidatus Pacearchaeota archaeon]
MRDRMYSSSLPLECAAHFRAHVRKNEQDLSHHTVYFNLSLSCAPPILYLYLDKWYQQKGFSLAPDASGKLEGFSLRTYRHLSGSAAQVMLVHTQSEYSFFIEDTETASERKIRLALARC